MKPFKVQGGEYRKTGDREWVWHSLTALAITVLPDGQAVLVFEDGHIELRSVDRLTVEPSEMARLESGQ